MVSSLSSAPSESVLTRTLSALEGIRVPTIRFPLSSFKRTTWNDKKTNLGNQFRIKSSVSETHLHPGACPAPVPVVGEHLLDLRPH